MELVPLRQANWVFSILGVFKLNLDEFIKFLNENRDVLDSDHYRKLISDFIGAQQKRFSNLITTTRPLVLKKIDNIKKNSPSKDTENQNITKPVAYALKYGLKDEKIDLCYIDFYKDGDTTSSIIEEHTRNCEAAKSKKRQLMPHEIIMNLAIEMKAEITVEPCKCKENVIQKVYRKDKTKIITNIFDSAKKKYIGERKNWINIGNLNFIQIIDFLKNN